MTKHLLVVGHNARMREDFERYYEVHPDHANSSELAGCGSSSENELTNFPNFVHCCITSPPYRDEDGFSGRDIARLVDTLNEFLLGPIWLNFGDLAGQMERATTVPWAFQDGGFVWKQTLVWAKSINGHGQYTPHSSPYMFNTTHEYIYLMYPKQHREWYLIDRYADGDPYTDKSNIKRWKSGRKVKCPGSVWHLPYETVQSGDQKMHPHRFPLSLPTKCLKHTHLPENGWVLDPFAGSGTVALAAKNLGYNSLSYEKDLSMLPTIQERVPEIEVIE